MITGHKFLKVLLDGKFKPALELRHHRMVDATDFILTHQHNGEEYSVGFSFTDDHFLVENMTDRELIELDCLILRRLNEILDVIKCRHCLERDGAQYKWWPT